MTLQPDHSSLMALLNALVDELPPRMKDAGFSIDSCVASTRVGLDVLQYFGVWEAQEVAVHLAVWNAAAAQLRIDFPNDSVEVARRLSIPSKDDPGGPWTLSVGMPTGDEVADRDGAGHLVIAVPSVAALCDLTLDQASRPHKKIVLNPAVLPVSVDWLSGDMETAVVAYPTAVPDGMLPEVVLFYRKDAAPRYRASPNWRRTSGVASLRSEFKRVTGDVVRALRSRGFQPQ